jgi:hypothetical protein
MAKFQLLIVALILAACAAPPQPIPASWDPNGAAPAGSVSRAPVESGSGLMAPWKSPSYREYLVDATMEGLKAGPSASAPERVKFAYSICAADFAVAPLTPAERGKLDAWSRRDISISSSEWTAEQERERALFGPDFSTALDRMTPFCPDKIPAFRQYLRS